MAMRLSEASKLSNDMMTQGVIETVVKDSPVLQNLPFVEITGNGLTYNQEKTLPDIAFYGVGDEWDESTSRVPADDRHAQDTGRRRRR